MFGEIDPKVRVSPGGTPFAVSRHGKGLYYYANWAGGASLGIAQNQNRLVAHPLLIPYQTVIAEMGAWVTTGGGSGATIRFVIYGDTNAQPDWLIYDSGALAATTNSTAVFSTAAPLPITLVPGVYWFGHVSQGNATSATISSYTNANSYPVGMASRQATAQSTMGIFSDGVTGAPLQKIGTIGPIANCGQYWIKTL